MKIDLPITIIYDCQAIDPTSINRAAGHRVCTLRYDTEGDGTDAVLFHSYPPDEKPVMLLGREFPPQGEDAEAILGAIPAAADKKINAKAARWPGDYMAGTDQEREIAQEEADELAAQDSQFGAGA